MSKPQFVATADVHLHHWAAFARGDGVSNTRLQHTLHALRASLELAKELECPWLIGGDLVHTAGYTLNVVLAELTELLNRYHMVPKLAVWGNHDARGIGGRISYNQTIYSNLQSAVGGLVVLHNGHTWEAEDGLTFSGAGAQPSGKFEYAEPSDVGLYHGTVAGSVGPNGFVFEHGINPAELQKRHRVSIVGDIHHPQQIESVEGKVILVPGSPEHHNFGDKGAHGHWLVTLGLKKPTLKFFAGDSPQFLTVDTPADVVDDVNFYHVRAVPPGTELPANASVIAPTPTVVKAREGWQGGAAQTELALQAWLKEVPVKENPDNYLAIGRQLLDAVTPNNLSNLRVVDLRLENFCSYKHEHFKIEDGTWLVVGRGRDYPSNGAGKSSLFEALYWLLFGRTTKGLSGDDVIRWGVDGCSVTVTLENPNGLAIVARRAKVRGESAKLDVTDEMEGPWEATSVTEMTEKLGATVGLTPELFQALGYFSQERLLLFASATDGDRKDMLADLVGLSAYQEASAAAGHAVTRLETERVGVEGRVSVLTSQLYRDRLQVQELRESVGKWEDDHSFRQRQAEDALAQYDLQIDVRRAAITAQHLQVLGDSLERQVTKHRQTLDVIEREVDSIAAGVDGMPTKQEAQRVLKETRQSHSNAVGWKAAGLRDHTNAVGHQQRILQRAAEYKSQLEKDGLCPTCRQPVSLEQRDACLAPLLEDLKVADILVANALQKATENSNQAATLETAINEAEENLATVEAWENVLARQQRAHSDLHNLLEKQASITSAAQQLAEKDVAAERGMCLSKLERVEAEYNPHVGTLKVMEQSVVQHEQEFNVAEVRTTAIKWEASIYDYWRHGFSKQGLQSLLLDDVAARFNGARADVIPALTQGVYDVQFSTVSRTKAGDLRERTEFLITERGRAVPYEALSGGQRRRVDVGVMLTMVIAVSRWMGAAGTLGILVLDEVFDFLDAAGAEGLEEALRAVQQVVPAVYVIAHDPQLQALFPKVIRVEQDSQGISRIMEESGDNDRDVGRRPASGTNER